MVLLSVAPSAAMPLLVHAGPSSSTSLQLLPALLSLRGGAKLPVNLDVQNTQDLMVQTTLYLGTIMSALGGCIAAGEKQMDLLGCVVVGSITAIGGGTLRDVMLGRPPFWLSYTAHLHLAIWTSVAVFLIWPIVVSSGFKDTHLAFLWSDAIGMAASSVIGAHIGLMETGQYAVGVIGGLVTATFGGIGRDLLCLEPPRALYAERSMYATPSLLGAACYVLLHELSARSDQEALPNSVIASVAFTLALVTRAAAWTYRLALPRWARKSVAFGLFSRREQVYVEMAKAEGGQPKPSSES